MTSIILAFALMLALTACPKPTTKPADIPPQKEPVQPAPQTADMGKAIDEAAMNFMEKLGFDKSSLKITFKQIQSGEKTIQWSVIVENDSDVSAEFTINETTLRPEIFSLKGRMNEGFPPALKPGDDLTERIARALDLESEGYRPSKWRQEKVAREYRKYEKMGDLEICVGKIIIVAPLDPNALIIITFIEEPLIAKTEIKLDRDAAISIADKFIDKSGLIPINVELTQEKCPPFGPEDFAIFWEVSYGSRMVHVRADDGSILEAPQPQKPGA
ncbi:MAG: hypothetical protein ABIC40_02445 [bacterium]